ncbi:histone acetyltransferase KAT6B-like [Fundulus heteroclitus]|uniref:histone acetyltransferase KAT6B-like n=1 Tax=Fundulus heteroclitus TaxID=8078 RepID=UPI00165A3116|nr:histone acetyltransferase KAT6B-like [Fundulus heteroclitus]
MNQVPQRDSILRCIHLAPGFIEESLEKLEKEPKNSSYAIRVAEHKTSVQFGEATLALTQRGVSWVKRLRDIKNGAGERHHCILIRSALADSAKSALTPEERNKVSTFMCHDTKTADRFYVLNPSLQEAVRRRTLITDALSKVPSREKPSSSSAAHKRRAKKAGPAPKSTKAKGEWSTSEEEEEEEEEVENEEDEEEKEEEEEKEAAEEGAHALQMRSPSKAIIKPCSVRISPFKTYNLRLQRQRRASAKVRRVLEKMAKN